MVLSIEELTVLATNLRKEGLNTQQIADELSLSQDTITWLLTGTNTEERPTDVRIGWRTLGVRPARLQAIGSIIADVADVAQGESAQRRRGEADRLERRVGDGRGALEVELAECRRAIRIGTQQRDAPVAADARQTYTRR